jgi:hypothetical protein
MIENLKNAEFCGFEGFFNRLVEGLLRFFVIFLDLLGFFYLNYNSDSEDCYVMLDDC